MQILAINYNRSKKFIQDQNHLIRIELISKLKVLNLYNNNNNYNNILFL